MNSGCSAKAGRHRVGSGMIPDKSYTTRMVDLYIEEVRDIRVVKLEQ
jgi:hypothetical protein